MKTKKAAEILAFGVLLIGSMALGFMGLPAEMGLAIGAGAIALAFLNLEQIASLKGAGIELVTKEQIQAVIEKETESSFFSVEAFGTDENTKKVINALQNPKYTWRYPKGLAKESGLSSEMVATSLQWLVDNQLAKKSKGQVGDIWSLTVKGREVFEHSKKQ